MMSESQAQTRETKETVVTVKSEPAQPGVEGGIKLNIEYFKSIPGCIKLVQLVIGILCMALGSPPYNFSEFHWFLFVATTCFISTIIWVFFYFLSLHSVLSSLPVNWLLTELIYTGVATVCYLIAFIVALASPLTVLSKYIAAGVFGIFNTGLYGFGAFLLYKEFKGIQ